MTDFVGSVADFVALQTVARTLGFMNEDGDIVTNGTWKDSKGSWFLNIVGEIPEAPGYWVRLRWNEGDLGGRQEQFIAALRANGVTIYEQLIVDDEIFWSSDGTTPAPSYIETIGVIL